MPANSPYNKTPSPECEECLKILQSYIDGETTQEENLMVQHCLSICGVCKECYELEKTFIDAIRHKIGKPSVPNDLADCIKAKIEFEHQAFNS